VNLARVVQNLVRNDRPHDVQNIVQHVVQMNGVVDRPPERTDPNQGTAPVEQRPVIAKWLLSGCHPPDPHQQ